MLAQKDAAILVLKSLEKSGSPRAKQQGKTDKFIIFRSSVGRINGRLERPDHDDPIQKNLLCGADDGKADSVLGLPN